MNNIYFINKAKLIHGDRYDYSFVDYINNKTKIDIVCNVHGIFKQIPNDHLKGCGCSKCGFSKQSKLKNAIARESFIDRVINIHGEKYHYDLVNYIKSNTKINICCSIHGIFKMTPNKHLKGHGCSKCKIDNMFSTTDEFIRKANIIHGDKYDYSLVKYTTAKIKVDIICNKHEIFKQKPNDHLSGHGCPKCNESIGERIISNYLYIKNIKYVQQYSFENCKNIRKLFFDFYLPDYNTCIEYDGIQHYKSKDFFGGNNEFVKLKERDSVKNNYCALNNVKLFRIRYDENVSEKMDNIIFKIFH